MTTSAPHARSSSLELGPSTGLLRTLALGRLRGLAHGALRIRDAHGEVRVGGDPRAPLVATVTVHDLRFWRRLVLGGSLGAADAFVDGDWSTDDLVAVLRLFLQNADAMAEIEGGLARLGRSVDWLRHALNRNTRAESLENVGRHYDLGDELFRSMLDPTMTYSCGIFERPDATLEEASLAKIDRLLDALELRAEHHLLEIGSGWGALAVRAARRFGCRVTTTTLSRAQHDAVRSLVAAEGLEGRVTVLLRDYRDIRGWFDRIVSVEMIEAIGAAQYETFFRACDRLMRADGVLALQAITLPDSVFHAARRDVDFIRARIFPGSEIPSVTALLEAVTRASSLRAHSLLEIGPHYVPTLRAWRRNLEAARSEIERTRGEAFFRTFIFYLGYCEAGFSERYLGDVQMVLRGPRARLRAGAPPC